MALSRKGLRAWCLVHKWTSLVATLFLLLLCLTGLPLIFHHEIDELTRAPVLDADVQTSGRARHADIAAPPIDEGVMALLFDLHASLLLGLPGTLFLGLIGLVFIVAIVSGVVVYAPFMRRLAFGTVRKDRNRRIRWLDTHNLVGIVVTAWISVVALTGFILAMETPITLLWQANQLAELTAPYAGQAPPARQVPVDIALEAAQAMAPDSSVSFVAWPGTRFSSPSVPLHFGDYGGLPLKIIWALLDLAAMVVLVTGLYLWWKKVRDLPEALA